jgi:thiosulfate sulfurtransferase
MSESIEAGDLKQLLATGGGVVVVDIRRAADFEADPVMIPGARRGAPDAVETWAASLPAGAEIVVYCARGGSVSQSVTPQLRALGLQARYVAGGLAAWKENGGSVVEAD